MVVGENSMNRPIPCSPASAMVAGRWMPPECRARSGRESSSRSSGLAILACGFAGMVDVSQQGLEQMIVVARRRLGVDRCDLLAGPSLLPGVLGEHSEQVEGIAVFPFQ